MSKFLKHKIYIGLSLLCIIYIVICNFVMAFSLILNAFFFCTSFILFLYYLSKTFPPNKEHLPSFKHIFIKVVTYFYFIFFLGLILFNILYPKNYIKDENHFEYIIIFGAGIREGHTEVMDERLRACLPYKNKNDFCKFVLTGGMGTDEKMTEAEYMRQFLLSEGFDDKKLILEEMSTNTFENIDNSLMLIKEDILRRNRKENIIPRPFTHKDDNYDLEFMDIGFLSSEYHLSRINMMAKKKGIKKPFDIPSKTKLLYLPYVYVRESLSMLKALMLSQLEIF